MSRSTRSSQEPLSTTRARIGRVAGVLAVSLLAAGPAAAAEKTRPEVTQRSAPAAATSRPGVRTGGSGSVGTTTTATPVGSARRPAGTASARQRQVRSAWRDSAGAHHGHGHRGRRYPYYPYNPYYSTYPYYSPFYSPLDFYLWRWPYYWGPVAVSYYGAPYYRAPMHGGMGALDLNVRPKKAEVFIDGQLVGVADNYDGWPSYLWLDKGTYELVLFRDGYETVARQISIYPGVIIDVNDRMEPGEAVRPQEPSAVAVSAARPPEEVDHRESHEVTQDQELPSGEARPPEDAALLRLGVSPGDAAVYLDGRFLGSADELAALHSGLVVEPGEHELVVVRPRYGEKRRKFRVEAGEEVTLRVDMGWEQQ